MQMAYHYAHPFVGHTWQSFGVLIVFFDLELLRDKRFDQLLITELENPWVSLRILDIRSGRSIGHLCEMWISRIIRALRVYIAAEELEFHLDYDSMKRKRWASRDLCVFYRCSDRRT
jgi:hypothetical protein